MRFFWLAALYLSFLCFARGQSATELTSEIPPCALRCIFKYLPDSPCQPTDLACVCADKELAANITVCVQSSCTAKEGLTAARISAETCHTPVRDKHRDLQIAAPVLTAVAGLMVIFRVIARQPTKSDLFGWDDILIILAYITAVPFTIVQYYTAEEGLGRDVWSLSFDNITKLLRLFFISEPFYLTSTVLTKLSILFFYLRVFNNYSFRWIVWGVVMACLVFYIGVFFALIFQCRPISYAWTNWDGEHTGECINFISGLLSHAGINMGLDAIVLVLPLPLLYRLQISYSKMAKVRIFIMFSFGLIVTIISVLRLQTLLLFTHSKNPSYDYFEGSLWSSLETYTGIVCACLPSARIFFFRIVPQWMGLSSVGSAPIGPGPGLGDAMPPFALKSWATSTRTSIATRLSKQRKTSSAQISTLPEEPSFSLPQVIEFNPQQTARPPSYILTVPEGVYISASETQIDLESGVESNDESWTLGNSQLPVQTVGSSEVSRNSSRERESWTVP